MSGKIYNKNLTFLQDQPFAENLLTDFFYKKKRSKLSLTRDSSFPTQLSESQSTVGTPLLPSSTFSYGTTRVRRKSEKMIKAETNLIKHFCLILERTDYLYTCESQQNLDCSSGFKGGNIIPHLLVSVDSMQNTLLATRGSRPPERTKTPSQFKKILRECRKIRLLYGNLSMRHLSRATSKVRLPGENLLIWLESRLDVVLERCGFFNTVKAARESVLNGKILVNSKVVESPGFFLKGGDIIKIVQERSFFDSLDKKLSREVILSNEVFPSHLRNKSLETAISKTLPKFNSTSHLKPSVTSSFSNNKTADRVFDPSRLTKNFGRGFFPYKSFYTWLLKKKEKNFQSSEFFESQSKSLLFTQLQFKKLTAQNPIFLEKKALSLKNWRFIGSPHLLLSFFFLHAHLQKVMSFIAQRCNKNVFVDLDKDLVKHKTYAIQNWNNISTTRSKVTQRPTDYCSIIVNRGFLNFPTISFVSKCCAVNTLAICTESRSCQANKKANSVTNSATDSATVNSSSSSSSFDFSKFEIFLNLIQESLQNNKSYFVNPKISGSFTLQSHAVTNIHNYFGKDLVRVLTEVHNNLFTLPWYFYFYSKDIQDDSFSKGQDLSQLINNLVITDQEKNLLCVLFSDLLLYSLLIKKEVVSAHLERERPEPNNQIVSRILSTSVPSSKNRKTLDFQVSPVFESAIESSRVLDDNSRLLKMGYKKSNLKDKFDISQAKRIKPLHLEVSYQSLSAVFLFPPQRICLPIMVDVDCLTKAF